MQRNYVPEAAGILLFLVLATIGIAWSRGDITVSSWFYIAGSWPVGELVPWRQLYLIDRFPAVALVVAGLLLAVGSRWKVALKPWRRWSVFLVLYLAIGPGLIVNTGFKDGWGRPRPREIVQFGGKKEFHQPWQPGVRGGGRSFPSGHASAAFFMMAPFFIYRCRRPDLARRWLLGGVMYGIVMSVARITQGGHFLSDNLWAFGMVYLTGLALAVLMKLDQE